MARRSAALQIRNVRRLLSCVAVPGAMVAIFTSRGYVRHRSATGLLSMGGRIGDDPGETFGLVEDARVVFTRQILTDSAIAHVTSESLFSLARSLIPGGVNSPVRSFSAVGGTPRFIVSGRGPFVTDVEGNSYIDYVMSWGALINGHAFPPLVQAISARAFDGTSFGAPNPLEVELATVIVESVPAIEMIRFVNSGTEAAMSAVRLARAATGRELIVKFAGNYHGHADMLLAKAGSGTLTLGIPNTPGVTPGTAASTIVASYNNIAAIEAIFAELGERIAAVIVEPVAANMGVVEPAHGFLATIRRLTSEFGALCIFDEVITGFRVDTKGAQGLYNLLPDLTILGKIIGGGLPVGAYGGRRSIMEQMAPSGPVYQAGTLSGNPLTMAAGIANIQPVREPGFHKDLGERTSRIATGLKERARESNIPVSVNWTTGLVTLFFTQDPVTDLEEAELCNTERYAAFFHAMLDRGIFLPPSQFEAWMISSAHDSQIVDSTLDAAGAAFATL